MHNHSRAPRWRPVARQLSFNLEDTRTVNLCFVRWRRFRACQDKRAIDLWTYCYINRYFHVKSQNSPLWTRAELDQLVERAFLKVQRNLDNVQRPRRFSHWVSVVCKHTFINHLRQEIVPISLDDHQPVVAPAPSRYRGRYYDTEITYRALSAAIMHLPQFLRQTARLRFLRHLSYQQISEITGKPVATLRTYAHKATMHFQNDPQLRVLRDEILG